MPVNNTSVIDFVSVFDYGNMGSTETLDVVNGTWQQGTLNSACTITVTGYTVDEGVVVLFKVIQDGSGGHAITWDPDVIFGSGADTQPNTTAGSVTWFMLWSDEGDSAIYAAKIGAGDTAAQILAKLLTVDGSGSGLDADTLDGHDSSFFASAVSDTNTIDLTLSSGTLSAAFIPTADVSMASHKLTNVTDPGSAQDAATKNYVDTQVAAVPTGTGGGDVTAMFRWVADGGATYDYPDVVDAILQATDNGTVQDPTTLTLSSDRTQVTFDSVVTAGHIITSLYSVAQV